MPKETTCINDSEQYLFNPAAQIALGAASFKARADKGNEDTINQIMNPYGKTEKAKPGIDEDEMLRERVPPHKAATGWDSPEQKERILKARKRWRDIRLQQEQDLALEH